MSNIVLKIFWPNEPMPLNRKIDKVAITMPFGVMITHPTGVIKSVNNQIGDVVLNADDVGADAAGTADQVKTQLNTEIEQVRTLAQTNDLKIGTKADQVDLETVQQQVEQNRLAILTKADIQALAMLAQLIDTKADQSYVQQQIANLVGSAPEALNTIYELAAAIQSEQGLIDSLNQSVANRVRFDVATQALTEIQRQNARTNIDAEKAGTAAQLVNQITVASIGAATAAQGAKANTALQSADVAPVALSGLFSSLSGQNKIFDVVFSAYALGSNTAILATDTLGQMLGKLQAQINNAGSGGSSGFTWVNASTVTGFVLGSSITHTTTPLKFAKKDGLLWISGSLSVNNVVPTTQKVFNITNSSYFVEDFSPNDRELAANTFRVTAWYNNMSGRTSTSMLAMLFVYNSNMYIKLEYQFPSDGGVIVFPTAPLGRLIN